MPVKVHAAALIGVDAVTVTVEVEVETGLPDFTVIGLGDNAIKEARERVTCALKNCGYDMPNQILVNLAPAELKKEGASFDLPIALGILAASGMIDSRVFENRAFHGELALDGQLRPVRGAIALSIAALQSGKEEIILPSQNQKEGRLITGIEVTGCESLNELLRYLIDGVVPERQMAAENDRPRVKINNNLCDVWGQESAKRAMIIAAAGGHNVLLIGPPGCGKSMLAERFPGILPPLTRDEMLEVVKVHSVAGLPVTGLLEGVRPFRNPHYIVSDAGLVGGGTTPRPGEVTLAHRGVLFLDEFPEFRRSAIEALRTPLESGWISVGRAKGHAQFPARFQLIAAMNPCPCGRLGAQAGASQPCICSRGAVQNYLRKLSQPILDRIDLHVELSSVPISAMTKTSGGAGPNQEQIQESIALAQTKQRDRNGGSLNAELRSEEMKKVLKFSKRSLILLERAAEKIGLSARGFMRTLKVSQTVADLAASEEVKDEHVAEAIGFRTLERLQRYIEGRV